MKRSSLVLLLSSAWVAAGCGSRTSNDDLLGYSSSSAGGRAGTGGAVISTGGSGGVATGGSAALDCCSVSDSPGCADPLVQECVCGFDEYCCNTTWDGVCTVIAQDQCSATCMGSGGTAGAGGTPGTGGIGTGGGSYGDCCDSRTDAGCSLPDVNACVCQLDNYCCAVAWDQACVETSSLCGTACGAGGSGGSPATGGSSSGGASSGGASSGGAGTGGAMATGGAAAWDCHAAFTGSCGNCVCNGCYDQMNTCRQDPGCFDIWSCMVDNGCVGSSCYKPGVCKEIIDAYGGLQGSYANTVAVHACIAFSGCPCY